MPINKAIEIFKTKFPTKTVGSYAKTEDGYILIVNDSFDTIGCNYYIVTNDGKIVPTNPALCRLHKLTIEKI